MTIFFINSKDIEINSWVNLEINLLINLTNKPTEFMDDVHNAQNEFYS